MSNQHVDEARGWLEQAERTGADWPKTRAARAAVAQVHASLAIAEQLDRIADHLTGERNIGDE